MTKSLLRTVFMGTPSYGLPCLEILFNKTQLMGVICAPDKPSGRGLQVHLGAVKTWALAHDVPLYQPISLKNAQCMEQLHQWQPELIVVVAYGKILPAQVLNYPKYGCWNLHGSLLPKYRGAGPIQWALINAETVTGVTLMQMDIGMDTGPILLQQSCDILFEDNTQSLREKLSQISGEVLEQGLAKLLRGENLIIEPQDNAKATYAPLLTKAHGCIDFMGSSEQVYNQARGVSEWPGAYTWWEKNPQEWVMCKLGGISYIKEDTSRLPGEVWARNERGIAIACAKGSIWVQEIQLPGKAKVLAATGPILVGQQLGKKIPGTGG